MFRSRYENVGVGLQAWGCHARASARRFRPKSFFGILQKTIINLHRAGWTAATLRVWADERSTETALATGTARLPLAVSADMSFERSPWASWDSKTFGFVTTRRPEGLKREATPTIVLGSGRMYDKAEEARARAAERAAEQAYTFKPNLDHRCRSRSRPACGPTRETASSFIPTRVPANFPTGNSEPWINAVAGKVPRFNDGEHNNQPPRAPSPVFDSAGRIQSQGRWDDKNLGYIGTDRMA